MLEQLSYSKLVDKSLLPMLRSLKDKRQKGQFQCCIFTYSNILTMPGIVAYDPLFLIPHKDNSYHEFVISIFVGLLMLVVDHYRSSLLRLLY